LASGFEQLYFVTWSEMELLHNYIVMKFYRNFPSSFWWSYFETW